MSTAVRHETIPGTIPPRVAQRPRRGNVPILYTTLIGPDGLPDFRVSDPEKVGSAMLHGLCGICGQKLEYWMVFLVVPEQVADSRLRGSAEPAMHEECARFALSVCPYLLGTRDRRGRNLPEDINTEVRHLARRPERMVLGWTRGYKLVTERGAFFAIPHAFKRVEAF